MHAWNCFWRAFLEFVLLRGRETKKSGIVRSLSQALCYSFCESTRSLWVWQGFQKRSCGVVVAGELRKRWSWGRGRGRRIGVLGFRLWVGQYGAHRNQEAGGGGGAHPRLRVCFTLCPGRPTQVWNSICFSPLVRRLSDCMFLLGGWWVCRWVLFRNLLNFACVRSRLFCKEQAFPRWWSCLKTCTGFSKCFQRHWEHGIFLRSFFLLLSDWG